MADIAGAASAPFARVEIDGGPSADQVAAIVIALQAAWPVPVAASRPMQQSSSWRHADRWWNSGRLPSGWAARRL